MGNKMKIKYDLIVVGAGGTGTYFLKEVSRFMSGNGGNDLIKSMHIFDGDTVEEKNLKRQCFTMEDVGRNKAAVMAEILNEAFGMSFVAHPSYVTDISQIEKCFCKSNSQLVKTVPLIISCVDNHGCRLLLEKLFEQIPSIVLLDSGNEFSTGEVVYSYKMDGIIYGPVRSYYFPDIKEGDIRNREEISCEELNNVAPQHIFTNMQAGNLLCACVANLFGNKITPGFSYFNALNYETGFRAYSRA